MRDTICVFGSANDGVEALYLRAAAEFGRLIPAHGFDMIYGGSKFGLIGTVARAVQTAGGTVVGVIPKLLDAKGFTYREANDIIVTEDMYDRKALLSRRSCAFVVLPGGLGTLEEAFEVLTHCRLGYHCKPVVFLNTNGFYDPLINMLRQFIQQGFAHERYREMVRMVTQPDEAFALLRPLLRRHLHSSRGKE